MMKMSVRMMVHRLLALEVELTSFVEYAVHHSGPDRSRPDASFQRVPRGLLVGMLENVHRSLKGFEISTDVGDMSSLGVLL
jgi:hypothetical protein